MVSAEEIAPCLIRRAWGGAYLCQDLVHPPVTMPWPRVSLPHHAPPFAKAGIPAWLDRQLHG